MCDHHLLGDSRGLCCQNDAEHEPGRNCVYIGSSLGDKHDAADSAARQDNEAAS